jgi:hypothetical protein
MPVFTYRPIVKIIQLRDERAAKRMSSTQPISARIIANKNTAILNWAHKEREDGMQMYCIFIYGIVLLNFTGNVKAFRTKSRLIKTLWIIF